nr:1-deoxy-D-xylulose-5-phosphate synthase N-terminal domain-containing protein [Selenomonas sp. AE3005]
MYLEKVNSPQDIKGFSAEQRKVLAQEMRTAMLKRASIHGGHFGPDFGIVDKIIVYLIQSYENIKTLKPYEIRGFEVFGAFWGIYKNCRLVLERE